MYVVTFYCYRRQWHCDVREIILDFLVLDFETDSDIYFIWRLSVQNLIEIVCSNYKLRLSK